MFEYAERYNGRKNRQTVGNINLETLQNLIYEQYELTAPHKSGTLIISLFV